MMLMWWAVFFVSGCAASPSSAVYLLYIILLALCLPFASRDRRRFGFFILCASTSIVIWTASLLPEGIGSGGTLTGGVPPIVEDVRGRLIDSIDNPILSERSCDLLAALIFGSRNRLDRKLRDSYGQLGIAHFLALSGLHLGILMVPLVWGLSFLPCGRRTRSICTLVLIISYSFIAGMPPSLLRATALAALFMIQRSMGRKTTLTRSLLLAVFVLVLIDERILRSGGFQLSCLAVLAIALIGLPVVRAIRTHMRGRVPARLATFFLTPVVITISVNVLTLPLLLSFFGRAPLLAPVYNLLMFIPVTLLLYLGLLYAAIPIGTVRAFAAPPINLIADILWDLPIRLSSCPQPAILSGNINRPVYIAGTLLFVSALRMGGRKRVLCACAASLLAAASFSVGGGRSTFPGSSGDRAALEPYKLTKHILVFSDCLLTIEEDTGRREAEAAVRSLWKMGIGRIETLAICPAGLGWRGGVEYIAERINFSEVLCSPYLARHDGGLLDILNRRGVGIRFIERSDSMEVCGRSIRIVAPPYPPPERGTVPMEQAGIRIDFRPYRGIPEIEN